MLLPPLFAVYRVASIALEREQEAHTDALTGLPHPAHAVGLGMRVVAEGVEDEVTGRLLQEMGCDEAQGWLLCRAETAAVLTPWLLERHGRLQARAALRR